MVNKNSKKIIKKSLRVGVAILMIFTALGALILCANYTLALVTNDIDITVDKSPKWGYPKDTIEFEITYSNEHDSDSAYLRNWDVTPDFGPFTGSNWNISVVGATEDRQILDRSAIDIDVFVRIANDSIVGDDKYITITADIYDAASPGGSYVGQAKITIVTRVYQTYELNIFNETEDYSQPRGSNGKASFNFTVDNLGNGDDTVSMYTTGKFTGNTSISPKPGSAWTIGPNEKAHYKLTVSNIPEDLSKGSHTVTVNVQTENTSKAPFTADFDVDIPAQYELKLSLNEPSANKWITPSESITFNFTLTNEGNTVDNKIKVKTGFVNPAPYWTLLLNTQPSLSIPQDESEAIQIEVSAPKNQSYPYVVPIFVSCTTENNPTIDQNITVNSKTEQISEISLNTPSNKPLNLSTFTVSFPITVSNEGNGEDKIIFEPIPFAMFPVGETWSYNYEYEGTPISFINVPSQGSKQVYLNITGPTNPKYNTGFILYINISSDNNPLEKDSNEISILVGETYDVDITRLASEKQSVYPGDTISIKVRGENVGNFQDTFHFDVNKPTGAESWIPDFDPDILLDLGPNEIDESYLNITVDDDAQQGFYLFEIRCYPSKAPTHFDTFNINITVKPKYEIKLDVKDNESNTDPGVTTSFNFTVQNKGTGSCNITMDAVYENYLDVTITPSSFELPTATSEQMVWINITPSLSNPLAPKKDGSKVIVTVDIDEKEGGPEETENFWVNIDQLYDVDAYADTININPKPGTTSSFNITITNEGNGDDSFGIAIPILRTGWDVKPYDPAIPTIPKYNTDTLAQDEEERIMIKVFVPSTEKHISESMPINVSSRGDDSHYQIEIVIVNVAITHDVRFDEGTDNETKVEPGSYALFNVTIKNTGTIADNFTLALIYPPSFIDFQPLQSPLYLDVNKQGSVILNFTVDDSNIDDLPEWDIITVQVEIEGTLIVRTRDYTIDIVEVRSVRIGSAPGWQKGTPKQTLTYNLTIENTGTGDDRFALAIISNPPYSGWANFKNFGQYTPDLAPGEITYVDVDVAIPAKQQPREISLSVKAESKENPTKINITTFRFTIEQIYQLKVTVDTDKQIIDPGENATYFISVKNEGTGMDNVTLENTVTDDEDSVSNRVFSTEYLELSPGQTKTVSFTVTAVDEPKTGELNPKITIEVTSEEDTADPPESDTELIELEINPTVDIELTVDDNKKDIVPNLRGTKAEVEYSVTIWNRGLGKDSFDITETNNHGFKVDLSESTTQEIDPVSSTSITVKITIDNKAAMSAFDYFTNITVTSETNDQKTETISLRTKIKQVYGVELAVLKERIETEEVFVGNYRIVSFQIDIENTGTGDDNYQLELDGDDANWATLEKSTALSLGGKEKSTFNVTVKVPRETELGDVPIILRAISRGDDDKYDEDEDVVEEVTLTTEVTQFYELEMSSPEVSKKGEPGETIEFTVTISNQGNSKDSIRLRKDNPNIYWNWLLDSSTFDLDGAGTIKNNKPTDTRNVKVSVDIPTDEHGITGYYNITIELESEDAPSSQRRQDEIDLTVKVDPVYEVDLIKDSPTSADGEKVEPGRNVRYVFTVKNKGNIEDTFKISVSGTKSDWVVLQQTSVTIPPYDSEEISLTVNIDDLDDVGVDPEDIEAQKYSIIVKVTSEGDSEKIDEVTINPTVKEKYLIEIEADSESVEVDPNAETEYGTFTITVKNKGNTEDRLELSAKTTTDWEVKFDNKEKLSLDLGIGVSKSVEVKVYAPEKAKNGDNGAITITATSEDDTTKSDPYPVAGEVKTSSIKFANFEISGDKTVGSKVTIKLLVKNDGDVEAEDVEVKFYDKDKPIHSEKITSLDAEDEKHLEFTYELKEGEHDISAESEWSGKKIEANKAFTAEAPSFLAGDNLLIIIVIAMIAIFIIGILLASASIKRGIPEHLREEIAMAKQAKRMGKSPEEIEEMRRRKSEKQGFDRKRGGAGPSPGGADEERVLSPQTPTLPASEDKLLPPAGGVKGKGKGKKGGGKTVKIKCPKCDKVQAVSSTKRPIEFLCTNCGMKLVLKK